MWSNSPRRSWASSMTVPTNSLGTISEAFTYGSRVSTIAFASGICEGLCTSREPVRRLDLVGHVRRRHEQVEVELALEPLAHDVHVQQPEEAAAEAEAERLARLGLVHQRGVVEAQLLERVAQVLVAVGVGREEAGEHHRLDVEVAGQRLGRAAADVREGVADAHLGDVLDAGHDVADLARLESLDRLHARRHHADLLELHARGALQADDLVARRDGAVDDAHERDHAAVLVVERVEDERARGSRRIAGGRRDARADRVQHLGDARAGLGRDAQHVVDAAAEEVDDLLGDARRGPPPAGRSC